MKKTIYLLATILLLTTCKNHEGATLPTYNDSMILGADLSLLPRYEKFGAVYKDSLGNKVIPLNFFAQEKFNCIRVRLFVNPNTKSDACQNLDYVTTFAQTIKAAGFQFMLDLHYSDTWADPAQQTKPAAWSTLNFNTLTDTVYSYTKSVLTHLKAKNCLPDYIQTGNEITGGMLWDDGKISNPTNLGTLLKSATKACREVCPSAKIILHIESPQKTDNVIWFYNTIKSQSVNYD